MYKTVVTIWSENRISTDIDIIELANAVDNGDEIALGSIRCFLKQDFDTDPDFSGGWWSEDE